MKGSITTNRKITIPGVVNMLRLANMGVEVFRLDAVPYIWKQLGTNCRNLPQVHTIVRVFRIVLECVCPAVILKGEVVMPRVMSGLTPPVRLWTASILPIRT